MSEVVFHRLDRDLVVDRLRAFATSVVGARPEVRMVVLIGSLARGDWSARSDADLVVVVDDAPTPARDRSPHYTPVGVGIATDVFVFTEAEATAWSSGFRSEVERGIELFRRS